VNSTYSQHYGQTKFQANEVIVDRGNGTGFCLGNVDKYLQRYGKKGDVTEHRKDLFKILHYTLIALYVHDKENNDVQ
jgi:conjugal transfer/entry exclusion protein